jgi:hypothetical protein
MKQRIALVAVSALTAGVLSVMSAPVANAAGGAFGAITGNVLTNYCSATTNGTTAVTNFASDNTTYITVPAGTTITVALTNGAQQVRVGAPGLITAAESAMTIAGGGSTATGTANSSTVTVSTPAVGSFTIGSFDDANDSGATDTIYVTVAASCALNTFSLANSKVELQSPTYSAANSLVDEVPGTTNGVTLHLATILNNSYGSALSSGTWVATVTGGAVIGINLGNAAATPTAASVAAATGTGAYVNVAVSQGANLENKPWAGTITISYNGTTLVTKNAAITGDIATVKVSDPVIAKTGGSTYRTFTTNAYDSAGNRVAATLIPTATTMGSVVQNLIFTNATSATADTVTGNGVTCGATAGSAVVTAQTTNAAGATITSNTWTQTCAGSLYSYKASLDKATYNPGEVAVLTIEGLDSKGNLVFGPGAEAAADALVTTTGTGRINLLGATTATLASLAGTSLTVVTAPATTDAFVNGKAVYRFVVGSTAGSYTLAVNLPAVTTGTAQTVAYKINSDGSVSNADVLKSIVALIASINKQIQALQKLILKR